eukprot:7766788-Karenia_brevis.AAC.1
MQHVVDIKRVIPWFAQDDSYDSLTMIGACVGKRLNRGSGNKPCYVPQLKPCLVDGSIIHACKRSNFLKKDKSESSNLGHHRAHEQG